MKYWFIRRISAIMAIFLFAFIPVSNAQPYDVTEPEACNFNFTVLSDVHIEGNQFIRCQIYGKMLQDIKKNKSGNDALVFLGDNVMNGQHIESMLFYGLTNLYRPANRVINTVGNHDIGNGNGDMKKLYNRFYSYSNTFFNLDIDTPYYCKVIDGYYFIVLGTESQTVHDFDISEQQIDWLRTVISSAKSTGKPAFVFCHYDYDYADYGKAKELVDILTSYENVFYFHGHNHAPMFGWNFSNYDGIKQINISNCTDYYEENHKKLPGINAGIGLNVEIYDGKVVMRTRDFYNGEWLEDIQHTYTIK
ncbi:MAG: metallophosphoesterase [Clostridia bacterium]|nr:metallophosphoesterase [Clostridia bacterium]